MKNVHKRYKKKRSTEKNQMNKNGWEVITLDNNSFSPALQRAIKKEKEIKRNRNLELAMESNNRQILINYFLIYELIMKGVHLELERGNFTGARRIKSIEIETENVAIQGYVKLIRMEKNEQRTRDIRRYIIFINNCIWEILRCLGINIEKKFRRGSDLFSKRVIKQYIDRSTNEVYEERIIEEIGKKMKEKMRNEIITYEELQFVTEEVRKEMTLVRQDIIFVEVGNRKPEERINKEYEMSEENEDSEETEIEEF